MCIPGFLVSWTTFPIARRVFQNKYAFERVIVCWGTNTGVTITGMMLLKICDPDYNTPALAGFSMGFALMSIVSTIASPIYLWIDCPGIHLRQPDVSCHHWRRIYHHGCAGLPGFEKRNRQGWTIRLIAEN